MVKSQEKSNVCEKAFKPTDTEQIIRLLNKIEMEENIAFIYVEDLILMQYLAQQWSLERQERY